MILVVERAVKTVFPREPVAVKQYGSQASSLAVAMSDVDLAVTGLRITDTDAQLTSMAKLYNHFMGQTRILESCDFISSASVPVIKLVADL